MDKSNPRWVMVQDKPSKTHFKRKLEPLKHCSDSVSHHQLVQALKTTNSLPEPDMSKFQQDVRNIPLAIPFKSRSNTIGPPFPYPGAPVRGMGKNNHHLSKITNDRIQSALEERKRAVYTRQHETWALPIYGNFSQRENLMQGYRQYLKSQMEEKSWKKRQAFNTSLNSSRKSWEETQQAIDADNKADVVKRQNRRIFRDENKKMMEEQQALKKFSHVNEKEQERSLIKLDPINWSRTLR